MFGGVRKAPSLRRGHRPQEGLDHRFKATRLVVLKPLAGILYLLDSKAWVEILQFPCRFKGNNTLVPNHEQQWDVNGAHQLVIFRVWRCKNVKRHYSGLQPCRGYEFDEL